MNILRSYPGILLTDGASHDIRHEGGHHGQTLSRG